MSAIPQVWTWDVIVDWDGDTARIQMLDPLDPNPPPILDTPATASAVMDGCALGRWRMRTTAVIPGGPVPGSPDRSIEAELYTEPVEYLGLVPTPE